MDGIELLRERIQEETQLTVDSIKTTAKQQREGILLEARREAERILAENQAREARRDAEKAVQKDALDRLQVRRDILNMKQEVLQDTMQEVAKRLRELAPPARERLYSSWLSQAGAASQTITLAKADESWAQAYIRKTFPNLKVKAEAGNFAGGFLLEEGRAWQDYRFESVLKQKENQLLRIAAEILFPEQEEA